MRKPYFLILYILGFILSINDLNSLKVFGFITLLSFIVICFKYKKDAKGLNDGEKGE